MTRLLLTLLLLVTAILPGQRLPLIVDADTANEVDDLFALARALCGEEFDLRGITSAQFHGSPLTGDSSVWESQRLNEELLRLTGRTEVAHPLGAAGPLVAIHLPQASAASTFIVEQALAIPEGGRLHVAILGPATNVASAILQEPAIIDKLHVHYLGFWHNPVRGTYNKREFNTGNDTLAVELLLNTPALPLDVMTATTSQHLVFARTQVQRKLKSAGELGKYLLDRWDTYDRWWTTADPEKTEWTMWDVALIEALAHPELATLQTLPAPEENTRKELGIWTEIEVEKMRKDYWEVVGRRE